jgi:hypothetical protein
MKIDYLELLKEQRENCVKEYESYYAGSKEDFAPQCVIDSIRNAAIPTQVDLIENFHSHICQLIMEIDLYQNELSPLRKSNSFLKLKEFTDSEFSRKYVVAEEFKNIFENK